MTQCHIKSLKLNLFNLFTYRGSDETMHPMINKLVYNRKIPRQWLYLLTPFSRKKQNQH